MKRVRLPIGDLLSLQFTGITWTTRNFRPRNAVDQCGSGLCEGRLCQSSPGISLISVRGWIAKDPDEFRVG